MYSEDRRPGHARNTLPPLKEVLEQSTLDDGPVDDATAVVHALVRRDAGGREEGNQVPDAVDLAESMEKRPPHLCAGSGGCREMRCVRRPDVAL